MQDEHKPNADSPAGSRKRTSSATILRFAGMGTQLGISIGLGVLAGVQLDEVLGLKHPVGTAVCALLGLAGGMTLVLRALRH